MISLFRSDDVSPTWSGRKDYIKKLRQEFENATPETSKDPQEISTDKVNRLLNKHIDETSDEQLRRKQIAPFSMSEKKRHDKAQLAKTPASKKSLKLFSGKKQLAREFEDEDEIEDQIRVFSGVKVCLHQNVNRVDELKRIISQNGGTVVRHRFYILKTKEYCRRKTL